jgi:hypothetical protein
MDFRQDGFQYTKRFEALKTTLLVTVELVIVFLAAIALHFYFKKKDLDANVKTVRNFHQAMYENVTGETLPDARRPFPSSRSCSRRHRRRAAGPAPEGLGPRGVARSLTAHPVVPDKHGNKTLSDGTLFLEIESIDIQQSTTPGNESLTMMMRERSGTSSSRAPQERDPVGGPLRQRRLRGEHRRRRRRPQAVHASSDERREAVMAKETKDKNGGGGRRW